MSFWRSMRSLRRRLTRRRMPPSPASSRSLAGSDSSSESSLAAMMTSLKYTCVLLAGGPASGSCRGTSGSLRAGARGARAARSGARTRRTAPPSGGRRAERAALRLMRLGGCRAALRQPGRQREQGSSAGGCSGVRDPHHRPLCCDSR
jgi:hypothetical protein